MCQLASFIWHEENYNIKVFNLVSHSETYKYNKLSERQGWYEGHYRPNDTVQCRYLNGINNKAEKYIKEIYPTFIDFLKWSIKNGANIQTTDSMGWTALIHASGYGYLDIVKYLIKQGADIKTKDDCGWTALIHASRYGYLDIVKYLIKQGADIKTKDDCGWTALIHASRCGYLDVEEYLKKKIKKNKK